MNNEIMRNAIEQMSYFNAAEGSAWSKEASARHKLQKDTAQQAIDAGLSMEEFKAFYNDYVKEHGRGLTTFWDFGYSYKILKENQIMQEAKSQKREHKLDAELLALKKTALMQVETLQEITKENGTLFAEGILEGWLQALRIINKAVERTKDNAAR